jgi:sulfate adenylyltransferase large subunit
MAVITSPTFSINEFLAEEREKDLFRFSTAGSVDDGKSTLIGRLLYDTQSVYEDQVRSIEGKGTTAPGQIDFALLTDGLRAEREQGITIDVAYRYFSTARRKFIIADTPGHEQYTRNMATGSSTADASVVLIDASKGVLIQSRRHAYIASLLRVRHVIVAVNKMDLIGYGEQAFRAIEKEFSQLLSDIAADTGTPVEAVFVPVSALAGDNIVHRSGAMSWYQGPSLLELLESLPSSIDTRGDSFRFPVQRVLRPDHTFRGFAGQICSGTIHPGDRITVLPSGRSARVKRIVTYDGDLSVAHAPLSVTLVLDHEVDISRGDLIVASEAPATITKNLTASLVWMDQRPMELSRRYLLKHTSQTVPAFIAKLEYRTNIGTLRREPAESLEMNGIGAVSIQLLRPIALDRYRENRSTGAFILIDAENNSTVAAGMVTDAVPSATINTVADFGPVTVAERVARWGHRGGVIELNGNAELINKIERSLLASGAAYVRFTANDQRDESAAGLLLILKNTHTQTGLLTLIVTEKDSEFLTLQAKEQQLEVQADESNSVDTVQQVNQWLKDIGILVSHDAEGSL